MNTFRKFFFHFQKLLHRTDCGMWVNSKGKLWHEPRKTLVKVTHLKLHSMPHFQCDANVILEMKYLKGKRGKKNKTKPKKQNQIHWMCRRHGMQPVWKNRTDWLMGHEVTTASRYISPSEFQSDFCHGLTHFSVLLREETRPCGNEFVLKKGI